MGDDSSESSFDSISENSNNSSIQNLQITSDNISPRIKTRYVIFTLSMFFAISFMFIGIYLVYLSQTYQDFNKESIKGYFFLSGMALIICMTVFIIYFIIAFCWPCHSKDKDWFC